MTKGKKLLVAVILLVGLGAAYFGIQYNNSHKKAEDTSSDTTISLSTVDASTISSITLKSDDGTNTYSLKDGQWVCQGDESLAINQNDISDMTDNISKLEAERVVEDNVSDLANYGLENPSLTVTATLTDQSTKTFLIGNEVPIGSAYYFMEDGESTVYMVNSSMITPFQKTLSDLINLPSWATIDPSTGVQHVSIQEKGKEPLAIDYYENGDLSDPSGLAHWFITKPYSIKKVADDTQVNSMLQSISEIKFSKSIDKNPSDLSQYGLDNPTLLLDVNYDTKDDNGNAVSNNLNLMIGNKDENGDYYAKLEGEQGVYSVTGSQIDHLIGINPFDYGNKMFSLVNVKVVDDLDVNVDGQSYSLHIDRKFTDTTSDNSGAKADNASDTATSDTSGTAVDNSTDTATDNSADTAVADADTNSTDNSTATEPTEVDTYYLNGKEISKDDFTKLFQLAISLKADAMIPEGTAKVDNPDITIKYNRTSANLPLLTYSFTQYDDQFYQVNNNGVTDLLVSNRQLQDLVSELQETAK